MVRCRLTGQPATALRNFKGCFFTDDGTFIDNLQRTPDSGSADNIQTERPQQSADLNIMVQNFNQTANGRLSTNGDVLTSAGNALVLIQNAILPSNMYRQMG
jgi:hypothetical protein